MTTPENDYPSQTKSFTNAQLCSMIIAILTAFMLIITFTITLTGKFNQVESNTNSIVEIRQDYDNLSHKVDELSIQRAKQDEVNTRLLEGVTQLNLTIAELSKNVARLQGQTEQKK